LRRKINYCRHFLWPNQTSIPALVQDKQAKIASGELDPAAMEADRLKKKQQKKEEKTKLKKVVKKNVRKRKSDVDNLTVAATKRRKGLQRSDQVNT
jgi:hypothetical protein